MRNSLLEPWRSIIVLTFIYTPARDKNAIVKQYWRFNISEELWDWRESKPLYRFTAKFSKSHTYVSFQTMKCVFWSVGLFSFTVVQREGKVQIKGTLWSGTTYFKPPSMLISIMHYTLDSNVIRLDTNTRIFLFTEHLLIFIQFFLSSSIKVARLF